MEMYKIWDFIFVEMITIFFFNFGRKIWPELDQVSQKVPLLRTLELQAFDEYCRFFFFY
jgi:hypothetical protein